MQTIKFPDQHSLFEEIEILLKKTPGLFECARVYKSQTIDPEFN